MTFTALCTACVYALAIGFGFCAIWAYLAVAWEQLQLSHREDWGSNSEGRWR